LSTEDEEGEVGKGKGPGGAAVGRASALVLAAALALSPGAMAQGQAHGPTDAAAAITAQVKAAIVSDDALQRSDVKVDTDGDVVTLRGTVPSEAARARALEIARTTTGVGHVEDRLEIEAARASP
jgi:hyperosmotically inducible protein